MLYIQRNRTPVKRIFDFFWLATQPLLATLWVINLQPSVLSVCTSRSSDGGMMGSLAVRFVVSLAGSDGRIAATFSQVSSWEKERTNRIRA